jgi:23S rRNA U2552 (ribose-2'-O)-methylase RlmE/FtsJ
MEFILQKKIEDTQPDISLEVYNKINNQMDNVQPECKLNRYRNKIDVIDPATWKNIRKKHNPYDFNTMQSHTHIINRAFYKLWEIIYKYNIYDPLLFDTWNILHLAEAPGGFIQTSLIYTSKKIKTQAKIDSDGFTCRGGSKRNVITLHQEKQVKISTMSLVTDKMTDYNPIILKNNVHVLHTQDNTGDITILENLNNINDTFTHITADGGFDEGNKFNNKEVLHLHLILSEIYGALKLNRPDGHFILKVFDLETNSSMHLMYLLSLFYTEISIYKPFTSRPTNSEKYIICKYFKPSPYLPVVLEKLLLLSDAFHKSNSQLFFKLFKNIPESFVNKIQQMNTQFIDSQIKNLTYYINLCNNDIKMDFPNKSNYYIDWCNKFNLQLKTKAI